MHGVSVDGLRTVGDASGAPTPFDLGGRLPRGTVLLEASAGTGKTYTIAGLVTRWVAETGLRLPGMLVVTFTRAATAELRDRVRERLVGAAEHLEQVRAGAGRPTDDVVLQRLADCPTAELSLRHERLVRAQSDVDVATISTIHGFCQHMLDGLGIAGGLDRDAQLVEDVHDLVEEVVDDLLVTTYLHGGDLPRVPRSELVAIGKAVVGNPLTVLAPAATQDPTARLRVELAARLRREVAERAVRRRQLSYDDLLTRLETTLRDPDRGPEARRALRRRYTVALIDEFQDTDPVQWSIVHQAFAQQGDERADGTDAVGRALVLIGDPKQAIYAFRGADVHAYLSAARGVHRQHTLGTSWRADDGLLRAFDALFGGARFGARDIPYRHVAAAPGRDAPGLAGAPVTAPLRLRLLPRHPDLPRTGGRIVSGAAHDRITRDVGADIVRLLDARPTLAGTRGAAHRALLPGDIAVLVRAHTDAAAVQQELQDRGVPAVVGGSGSVFATASARAWLHLLLAVERPAATTRVRALALSPWVGWRAADVDAAPDATWDGLHAQVHRWARILSDRGVAAMFRTVDLERGVAPRLLERHGGERALADLAHVAELAHAAATDEHLGATGLVAWLQERMLQADEESQDDRLRRLETDDDAVQVLTIHRSKGLEFPVVYCPFGWRSNTGRDTLPVFHDEGGHRQIDVGGPSGDDFGRHQDLAQEEAQGEELRLLYVALTRARHQVAAWYAPAGMCEWSGLGRLLLNRDDDGDVDTSRGAPAPRDDQIAAAADRLVARGRGTVAVEEVPADPGRDAWRPPSGTHAALDRARFGRRLDEQWRRTSYSALTRLDDDEPRVGSEPREATKDDEPDTVEENGTAVAAPVTGDGRAVGDGGGTTAAGGGDGDAAVLRSTGLPLGAMAGGTRVGTYVHRLLEHTDFTATDLPAALETVIDDGVDPAQLGLDRAELVAGLTAAITTPLGAAAGGLRLRDLAATDRRDEVAFELPLDRVGSGQAGGRPAAVGDLLDLMTDHLPADDPLRAYPAEVPAVLHGRTLRGYLNGSIDLVLRRHTDDGPVFHLVDHKTNRLGTPGVDLSAWDYRPAALSAAMMHGDYPIQALLYAVALHRTLRWRLRDYDPDRHVGAVLYLFLRGMAGPSTPTVDGRPCGVFAWQLPPQLVTAASDLLHGVAP